eukprot:Pgem_evm1s15390
MAQGASGKQLVQMKKKLEKLTKQRDLYSAEYGFHIVATPFDQHPLITTFFVNTAQEK